MKQKKILKSIAVILIGVLIFQDLAYALPQGEGVAIQAPNATFVSQAKRLLPDIPESIATIEDAWKNDSWKNAVILIQDPHANPSGQMNVAKTVESILDKTGPYVFLEAGSGNESLAFLRKYASAEKRHRIAKSHLLKSGLQGVEYLNLTSNRDFKLWGVEDMGLYGQSVELYREVAKNRARFENYLNKIESACKTLRPKILNPLLLGFDTQYEKHYSGEITALDYFHILQAQAQTHAVSLNNYPQIRKLKKLKGLESIQRISSKKRQERIYQRHLRLSKKISFDALIEEQRRLENEIFRRLTKSEEEYRLLECQKALRYFKKLLNLSLTPEEYRTSPESISFFTGFLNRKIMELGQFYEQTLFLSPDFEEIVKGAEAFYELTLKRDEKFIENMLGEVSRSTPNDMSILIAGGYHAPNLKALLKSRNISYISIRPQVYRETNQALYERILLNQPRISQTATVSPVVAQTNMPLRAWNNGMVSILAAQLAADVAVEKTILEEARGARLTSGLEGSERYLRGLRLRKEQAGDSLKPELLKQIQSVITKLEKGQAITDQEEVLAKRLQKGFSAGDFAEAKSFWRKAADSTLLRAGVAGLLLGVLSAVVLSRAFQETVPHEVVSSASRVVPDGGIDKPAMTQTFSAEDNAITLIFNEPYTLSKGDSLEIQAFNLSEMPSTSFVGATPRLRNPGTEVIEGSLGALAGNGGAILFYNNQLAEMSEVKISFKDAATAKNAWEGGFGIRYRKWNQDSTGIWTDSTSLLLNQEPRSIRDKFVFSLDSPDPDHPKTHPIVRKGQYLEFDFQDDGRALSDTPGSSTIIHVTLAGFDEKKEFWERAYPPKVFSGSYDKFRYYLDQDVQLIGGRVELFRTHGKLAQVSCRPFILRRSPEKVFQKLHGSLEFLESEYVRFLQTRKPRSAPELVADAPKSLIRLFEAYNHAGLSSVTITERLKKLGSQTSLDPDLFLYQNKAIMEIVIGDGRDIAWIQQKNAYFLESLYQDFLVADQRGVTETTFQADIKIRAETIRENYKRQDLAGELKDGMARFIMDTYEENITRATAISSPDELENELIFIYAKRLYLDESEMFKKLEEIFSRSGRLMDEAQKERLWHKIELATGARLSDVTNLLAKMRARLREFEQVGNVKPEKIRALRDFVESAESGKIDLNLPHHRERGGQLARLTADDFIEPDKRSTLQKAGDSANQILIKISQLKKRWGFAWNLGFCVLCFILLTGLVRVMNRRVDSGSQQSPRMAMDLSNPLTKEFYVEGVKFVSRFEIFNAFFSEAQEAFSDEKFHKKIDRVLGEQRSAEVKKQLAISQNKMKKIIDFVGEDVSKYMTLLKRNFAFGGEDERAGLTHHLKSINLILDLLESSMQPFLTDFRPLLLEYRAIRESEISVEFTQSFEGGGTVFLKKPLSVNPGDVILADFMTDVELDLATLVGEKRQFMSGSDGGISARDTYSLSIIPKKKHLSLSEGKVLFSASTPMLVHQISFSFIGHAPVSTLEKASFKVYRAKQDKLLEQPGDFFQIDGDSPVVLNDEQSEFLWISAPKLLKEGDEIHFSVEGVSEISEFDVDYLEMQEDATISKATQTRKLSEDEVGKGEFTLVVGSDTRLFGLVLRLRASSEAVKIKKIKLQRAGVGSGARLAKGQGSQSIALEKFQEKLLEVQLRYEKDPEALVVLYHLLVASLFKGKSISRRRLVRSFKEDSNALNAEAVVDRVMAELVQRVDVSESQEDGEKGFSWNYPVSLVPERNEQRQKADGAAQDLISHDLAQVRGDFTKHKQSANIGSPAREPAFVQAAAAPVAASADNDERLAQERESAKESAVQYLTEKLAELTVEASRRTREEHEEWVVDPDAAEVRKVRQAIEGLSSLQVRRIPDALRSIRHDIRLLGEGEVGALKFKKVLPFVASAWPDAAEASKHETYQYWIASLKVLILAVMRTADSPAVSEASREILAYLDVLRQKYPDDLSMSLLEKAVDKWKTAIQQAALASGIPPDPTQSSVTASKSFRFVDDLTVISTDSPAFGSILSLFDFFERAMILAFHLSAASGENHPEFTMGLFHKIVAGTMESLYFQHSDLHKDGQAVYRFPVSSYFDKPGVLGVKARQRIDAMINATNMDEMGLTRERLSAIYFTVPAFEGIYYNPSVQTIASQDREAEFTRMNIPAFTDSQIFHQLKRRFTDAAAAKDHFHFRFLAVAYAMGVIQDPDNRKKTEQLLNEGKSFSEEPSSTIAKFARATLGRIPSLLGLRRNETPVAAPEVDRAEQVKAHERETLKAELKAELADRVGILERQIDKARSNKGEIWIIDTETGYEIARRIPGAIANLSVKEPQKNARDIKKRIQALEIRFERFSGPLIQDWPEALPAQDNDLYQFWLNTLYLMARAFAKDLPETEESLRPFEEKIAALKTRYPVIADIVELEGFWSDFENAYDKLAQQALAATPYGRGEEKIDFDKLVSKIASGKLDAETQRALAYFSSKRDFLARGSSVGTIEFVFVRYHLGLARVYQELASLISEPHPYYWLVAMSDEMKTMKTGNGELVEQFLRKNLESPKKEQMFSAEDTRRYLLRANPKNQEAMEYLHRLKRNLHVVCKGIGQDVTGKRVETDVPAMLVRQYHKIIEAPHETLPFDIKKAAFRTLAIVYVFDLLKRSGQAKVEVMITGASFSYPVLGEAKGFEKELNATGVDEDKPQIEDSPQQPESTQSVLPGESFPRIRSAVLYGDTATKSRVIDLFGEPDKGYGRLVPTSLLQEALALFPKELWEAWFEGRAERAPLFSFTRSLFVPIRIAIDRLANTVTSYALHRQADSQRIELFLNDTHSDTVYQNDFYLDLFMPFKHYKFNKPYMLGRGEAALRIIERELEAFSEEQAELLRRLGVPDKKNQKILYVIGVFGEIIHQHILTDAARARWEKIYPLEGPQRESGVVFRLSKITGLIVEATKFYNTGFAIKLCAYLVGKIEPGLVYAGLTLRPQEREFFDQLFAGWIKEAAESKLAASVKSGAEQDRGADEPVSPTETVMAEQSIYIEAGLEKKLSLDEWMDTKKVSSATQKMVREGLGVVDAKNAELGKTHVLKMVARSNREREALLAELLEVDEKERLQKIEEYKARLARDEIATIGHQIRDEDRKGVLTIMLHTPFVVYNVPVSQITLVLNRSLPSLDKPFQVAVESHRPTKDFTDLLMRYMKEGVVELQPFEPPHLLIIPNDEIKVLLAEEPMKVVAPAVSSQGDEEKTESYLEDRLFKAMEVFSEYEGEREEEVRALGPRLIELLLRSLVEKNDLGAGARLSISMADLIKEFIPSGAAFEGSVIHLAIKALMEKNVIVAENPDEPLESRRLTIIEDPSSWKRMHQQNVKLSVEKLIGILKNFEREGHFRAKNSALDTETERRPRKPIAGLRRLSRFDGMREAVIGVAGLMRYFEMTPKKLDELTSFFKLPDAETHTAIHFESNGVLFHRRRLSNRAVVWAVNKDEIENLAQVLGWRVKDSLEAAAAEVNLQDAVAGMLNNPQGMTYLLALRTGMSPDAAQRMAVEYFQGLRGVSVGRVMKNYDTYDLEREYSVFIDEYPDPESGTDQTYIQIKGRIEGGYRYVQIEGGLHKVVVANDGVFTARLIVPPGVRTHLKLFGFEDPEEGGRGRRSDSVEIEIRQTSTPKSEAQILLEAYDRNRSITREMGDAVKLYEEIRRYLETQQLGLFTEGEEEGFRRLDQEIEQTGSETLKEFREKFRQISNLQIPGLRESEKLYFYQKWAVASLCEMIEKNRRMNQLKQKLESGDITEEVFEMEMKRLGAVNSGIILALDPRLGKTLIVQAALRTVGGKAAVVSPNSVKMIWGVEENKFFTDEDRRVELIDAVNSRARIEQLRNSDRAVQVMNKEFLRPLDGRHDLINEDLEFLIVDEGDFLGRAGTEQSKGVQEKLKPRYKVLVSATPFGNGKELFNIYFFIADPNMEDYGDGKKHYQAFKKGDPNALIKLRFMISPHLIRLAKDKLFQAQPVSPRDPLTGRRLNPLLDDRLPIRVDMPIHYFDLTSAQEQALLYGFIDWDRLVQFVGEQRTASGLSSIEDSFYDSQKTVSGQEERAPRASGWFTKTHRLNDITSDPSILGEVASPKYEAIDRILEDEIFNKDAKVVIYTTRKEEVRKLAARYTAMGYGPLTFYGETDDEPMTDSDGYVTDEEGNRLFFKTVGRNDFEVDSFGRPIIARDGAGAPMTRSEYNRRLFQNDPNSRILIVTDKFAAFGQNFSAGHAVIAADLPNDPVTMIQLEERIYAVDNNRKKEEARYYVVLPRYSDFIRQITERFTIITNLNSGLFSTIPTEEVTDQIRENEDLEVLTVYEKYFEQGPFQQVNYRNLMKLRRVISILLNGLQDPNDLAHITAVTMARSFPSLSGRNKNAGSVQQVIESSARSEVATEPPALDRKEGEGEVESTPAETETQAGDSQNLETQDDPTTADSLEKAPPATPTSQSTEPQKPSQAPAQPQKISIRPIIERMAALALGADEPKAKDVLRQSFSILLTPEGKVLYCRNHDQNISHTDFKSIQNQDDQDKIKIYFQYLSEKHGHPVHLISMRPGTRFTHLKAALQKIPSYDVDGPAAKEAWSLKRYEVRTPDQMRFVVSESERYWILFVDTKIIAEPGDMCLAFLVEPTKQQEASIEVAPGAKPIRKDFDYEAYHQALSVIKMPKPTKAGKIYSYGEVNRWVTNNYTLYERTRGGGVFETWKKLQEPYLHFQKSDDASSGARLAERLDIKVNFESAQLLLTQGAKEEKKGVYAEAVEIYKEARKILEQVLSVPSGVDAVADIDDIHAEAFLMVEALNVQIDNLRSKLEKDGTVSRDAKALDLGVLLGVKRLEDESLRDVAIKVIGIKPEERADVLAKAQAFARLLESQTEGMGVLEVLTLVKNLKALGVTRNADRQYEGALLDKGRLEQIRMRFDSEQRSKIGGEAVESPPVAVSSPSTIVPKPVKPPQDEVTVKWSRVPTDDEVYKAYERTLPGGITGKSFTIDYFKGMREAVIEVLMETSGELVWQQLAQKMGIAKGTIGGRKAKFIQILSMLEPPLSEEEWVKLLNEEIKRKATDRTRIPIPTPEMLYDGFRHHHRKNKLPRHITLRYFEVLVEMIHSGLAGLSRVPAGDELEVLLSRAESELKPSEPAHVHLARLKLALRNAKRMSLERYLSMLKPNGSGFEVGGSSAPGRVLATSQGALDQMAEILRKNAQIDKNAIILASNFSSKDLSDADSSVQRRIQANLQALNVEDVDAEGVRRRALEFARALEDELMRTPNIVRAASVLGVGFVGDEFTGKLATEEAAASAEKARKIIEAEMGARLSGSDIPKGALHKLRFQEAGVLEANAQDASRKGQFETALFLYEEAEKKYRELLGIFAFTSKEMERERNASLRLKAIVGHKQELSLKIEELKNQDKTLAKSILDECRWVYEDGADLWVESKSDEDGELVLDEALVWNALSRLTSAEAQLGENMPLFVQDPQLSKEAQELKDKVGSTKKEIESELKKKRVTTASKKREQTRREKILELAKRVNQKIKDLTKTTTSPGIGWSPDELKNFESIVRSDAFQRVKKKEKKSAGELVMHLEFLDGQKRVLRLMQLSVQVISESRELWGVFQELFEDVPLMPQFVKSRSVDLSGGKVSFTKAAWETLGPLEDEDTIRQISGKLQYFAEAYIGQSVDVLNHGLKGGNGNYRFRLKDSRRLFFKPDVDKSRKVKGIIVSIFKDKDQIEKGKNKTGANFYSDVLPQSFAPELRLAEKSSEARVLHEKLFGTGARLSGDITRLPAYRRWLAWWQAADDAENMEQFHEKYRRFALTLKKANTHELLAALSVCKNPAIAREGFEVAQVLVNRIARTKSPDTIINYLISIVEKQKGRPQILAAWALIQSTPNSKKAAKYVSETLEFKGLPLSEVNGKEISIQLENKRYSLKLRAAEGITPFYALTIAVDAPKSLKVGEQAWELYRGNDSSRSYFASEIADRSTVAYLILEHDRFDRLDDRKFDAQDIREFFSTYKLAAVETIPALRNRGIFEKTAKAIFEVMPEKAALTLDNIVNSEAKDLIDKKGLVAGFEQSPLGKPLIRSGFRLDASNPRTFFKSYRLLKDGFGGVEGARLAGFFEGVAHAGVLRSGKMEMLALNSPNDEQTYLYKVRLAADGRGLIAIPRDPNAEKVLLRETKFRTLDSEVIEKLENRVNQRVEQSLRPFQRRSPKTFVVRFDIDYLKALDHDIFEQVWAEFLGVFKLRYGQRAVFQIVSPSNDEARVELALSHALIKEFPGGAFVRELGSDLEVLISEKKIALVDVISVSSQKGSVVQQAGRTLPVRALKATDIPATASLASLIQAVASANLSSPEDLESLAAAWQVLSGLSVPAQTLRRLLSGQVSPELLLRYALSPIVSVKQELMRARYNQRFIETAA